MFRRIRVAPSLVSVLAALAALGGVALAQQAGQANQTAQQPPAEAGGSVEVKARAQLTGPEQLAEAEKVDKKANQISRRIQAMLAQARRDKDIIRVTCLNDKLTQVDANLRTLQERIGNLQAAVQSSDTDRRDHEYTVITVLAQKFTVLEQEANQCVGQDIFETGATRVVTQISPTTPEENPNQLNKTPGMEEIPFIPPPISPTT